MYNKPLKKLPAWFYKLYFRSLLKSYPSYQPIFLAGNLVVGGNRDCIDRWELIKNEINNYQAKSVIDIGCAEGFYVLQAAKECNCVSLGVDADVRRLSMAQAQLASEKIMPAGFLYAVINNEVLKKMPSFDVVIFMSVMHHMMSVQGKEYCMNFLKRLRARLGKVMIFEMGQSDETVNAWAGKLPDMGSNPHEWIKNFLLSCRFSKVIKIGESDSYGKDKNRAIFKVEP